MNAKQRELWDALGKAEGAGANEPLSLSPIEDRAALLAVAEEMVAAGWLRHGSLPQVYARTEEGRLALAGPLDVTLYTRPGCHLCDQAKALITPLLKSAGARLREVNIDADDTLRQRHNLDVPVIFLGTRKVAKHLVDLRQFEKQLAEASRNASEQDAT